MTDLQETLLRVARGFMARDIMIPLERLTYAEDEVSAFHELEKNPQYDTIPMVQKGRLVAFLERGAKKVTTIQIQHVVSAETPIPNLLNGFPRLRQLFVVGQLEVVGMIHFSDLNDPMVRLPFFVLLEGLERQLAENLRPDIQENTLGFFIGDPKRLTGLEAKMSELRKRGADREWVSLLYFPEVLRAAVKVGIASFRGNEIDDLSAVRNRIAHPAKGQLVEKLEDVYQLDRVWKLCTDYLFPNKN